VNGNNLCFACTPPKCHGACSGLGLPSVWQLESGSAPAPLSSCLPLGITVGKAPKGAKPSARCESSRLLPEERQQTHNPGSPHPSSGRGPSFLSPPGPFTEFVVALPGSYAVPPLQRHREEAVEPHLALHEAVAASCLTPSGVLSLEVKEILQKTLSRVC